MPDGRREARRLEARRERLDDADEIAAREHRRNAGRAARRRGVDGGEHGVSDRAPHEDGVGEPGQDDVVEKAAPAGEEAGILDALDPRSGEARWRTG